MSDAPQYVLERVFDAPRPLVWRAWTDPALFARWYGPKTETIVHRSDLKPGGLWLIEMRWGETAHFQRADFAEVVEPERLVWIHATADANWTVVADPMRPDWPRRLLTVVTFEAQGERTMMRLTWTPHEASDAEKACFAAAIDGLDKGWGAGMAELEALLAELR